LRAGGNTIGQYFTPRWLTTLMARLAHVTLDDTVLDPCAGTGGFLIAAAYEAQANAKRSGQGDFTWQHVIDQVKYNLYGFEAEPLTAALCVVNMVRQHTRCALLRTHLRTVCAFFNARVCVRR
jgi:type I restriction-modification system DNA methylase subunit